MVHPAWAPTVQMPSPYPDTNPVAGLVRLSPPPALLVQMDRPRPVEEHDHASSRSANLGQVSPAPFEEIYEQHSPDIYRYCLARLADPTAAEDATANTFMKAFSAYSRVGPASDGVRLWLFRIATNVVKDHHRHQSRRRRLVAALVGTVRVEQDPEDQAMLGVELQRILDALADLPSRERHLVGLRAGAGLPFSEIATLMNMNENSARVATHRALQRLRTAVEANR
jgi:RNA polymerase sigma factor (sigma-70 family)